jgi:4-amino-4-deoxychorismate lyase
MTYWYCGTEIDSGQISLDVTDAGLLYGATIFTTLRVDLGKSIDCPATAYELHCQRLAGNISEFGWQSPDWARLRSGVETIARSKSVVRMTLFPDGRELVTGRDVPADLDLWHRWGIMATIADVGYDRSIARSKTGNYLAPWLARQAAVKMGAMEAILINRAGSWLETSSGNLWGYRAGCWYTPVVNGGILSGIARSQILQHLKSIDAQVVESDWQPDLVESLEAIGYSNSIVGIVGIKSILDALAQPQKSLDLEVWKQLRQIWA